jgi:hypothetical protein
MDIICNMKGELFWIYAETKENGMKARVPEMKALVDYKSRGYWWSIPLSLQSQDIFAAAVKPLVIRVVLLQSTFDISQHPRHSLDIIRLCLVLQSRIHNLDESGTLLEVDLCLSLCLAKASLLGNGRPEGIRDVYHIPEVRPYT